MKMRTPFKRNRDKTPTDVRPPRRRSLRKPIIGLALVSLALLIAAGLYWRPWSTTASAEVPTAPVVRGDIQVTVESSGTVKPAQSVDLFFQSSGKVKEVEVEQNQQVKAGQVLARLDDRDLRLQVQQAEADLKTAESQLETTAEGDTTPEKVAEAQAAIRGAQAQLDKARTGNVTAADIANAEAVVRAAEAQLVKAQTGNVTAADIANAEAAIRAAEAQVQKAQSGPTPDAISAAQTTLRLAEQNYEKVAANASAAKTTAQQTMDKAADSVRLAQEAYSSAFWDNQQAQDGRDPRTGQKFINDNEGDAKKREYEEALRNAQLQLSQAETSLEQAKVAYENARQQEINDVATAQAQIDDARVQLDELTKGPKAPDVTTAQAQLDQARAQLQKLKQGGTAADIAAARAQLDQARAQLQKLRQGGTAADIAAARAQVEQLQAGLEGLRAPVPENDIERADAAVAQAAARVEAAKLKLDQAVLEAPFEGTITAMSAVPGSYVSTGGAGSSAFTLVDLSSLHLDVSLSESDVARVQNGQTVIISFDALPDQTFEGKVTAISPTAQEQNSVVTYLVRVDFDAKDAAIKVGMTASASFIVEQKQGVIQVPNRAIQTIGQDKIVKVMYEGKLATVRVQTGTTNGTVTEIVTCVDTKNQCLREGDKVSTMTLADETSGGADQGNSLIQIGPNTGARPAGPPISRPLP
ncbi:MAG: efflux RND transporter periplasmic adaptor subunit [Chloroflexi bacterium]|nr:efflux RND transporter periplasmic adaptor subunit [Chloroflexota bacterium]